MTSDGLTYRFQTAAQQRLCLVMAVAERRDLDSASGERIATLPGEVSAFLMLAGNRPAWIASDGALMTGNCAGPVVGKIRRMTAARTALWVLSAGGLHRLDPATLQVLEIADAEGAADIAAADNGLWLLLPARLLHVSKAGTRTLSDLPAGTIIDRIAAHGQCLALLDGSANRLILQRPDIPDRAISLGSLLGSGGARFAAQDIQSTAAGFLLSGLWDGTPGFAMLDGNGEPGTWGTFTGDAPAALGSLDDALFALIQHPDTATILGFPGATALGGELWLTPAMESDTLAGDWLQASISATLPEGATLALRWATSRDEALRTAADALMRDERRLLGERAHILGTMLDWSPVTRTFVGAAQTMPPPKPEPFCFPLAGAAGSFLWLELRLDRNNAPGEPAIQSIVVSHDMPGLMHWLPAVYSTTDGDLDGTLGRLVGLFQAISGELDTDIDGLAKLFDPWAAPAPWLPRLAGLLELPFDATLPEAAQRRVIAAAPALLAQRGTRAAILTLLTAAFGPRAYRVIDRTPEFAPTTLGSTALPAFLTGPSAASPVLGARLVLGRTPLACPGSPPPQTVQRAPELFVEIPASPFEGRRYRTAIETMLAALVPAGVRLKVRWSSAEAGIGGDILTVLDDGRPLALGDGRPLGTAPLAGPVDVMGSAGMSTSATIQ